MPLTRKNPRRVVTIDNLSFADGSVSLVDPEVLPPSLIEGLATGNHSLECIYEFSLNEGVLDEDDFEFLCSLSGEEAKELWVRVYNIVAERYGYPANLNPFATAEPDLKSATGLSPEEEAQVDEFSKLLDSLMTAPEPELNEEEGDDGNTVA